MMYPEPEKGGRGKKKAEEISTLFSAKLLQQDRTVLTHSRPLTDSVLAGGKPFDVAYQAGKNRHPRRQLGTGGRREETVDVVFRRMKANMVLAIAGGYFVAIWNEEHVWFCRKVVVSHVQEDRKTTSPRMNIVSGDGFTISTIIVSLAARERIGPAASRLMGVGSNWSAERDSRKCDQGYD